VTNFVLRSASTAAAESMAWTAFVIVFRQAEQAILGTFSSKVIIGTSAETTLLHR
jgi:hypothetical protein